MFGYVGRLSPEKNLRVLGSLERALQATGRLGYRIEIVGHGNVVWESAASGVPAVVTNAGGPPHIVRHGVTGLVSQSDGDFVDNALRLLRDPNCRLAMGRAVRKAAPAQSWEAVFDGLYSRAYRTALES